MKHLILVVLVALLTVFGTAVQAQELKWVAKTALAVSPVVKNTNGETDHIFSALLITFDAASLADLVFTKRALARGNGVYEKNPIMRMAIRNTPLDWALKLTSISIVNFYAKECYRENKTVAYIITSVLAGGYTWVAYRNYRIGLKFSY